MIDAFHSVFCFFLFSGNWSGKHYLINSRSQIRPRYYLKKRMKVSTMCTSVERFFSESSNSTVDSSSSAVDMIKIPPNKQNVQEHMSENTDIHLPCQPETA